MLGKVAGGAEIALVFGADADGIFDSRLDVDRVIPTFLQQFHLVELMG